MRIPTLIVEQLGDALQRQSWDINLELHELMDAIECKGKLFDPPISFHMTVERGWITGIGRYTGSEYDDQAYGIVARVITSDGAAVELTEDVDKLRISNSERILIVAKMFVYEPQAEAVDRIKGELSELTPSYEALLNNHLEDYRPRFEACSVEFGDAHTAHSSNEALLLDAYSGTMSVELLQKMTDYGRYLLLNSSDKGSVPSNLQGIWNGDYAPPWDCFFMINENLLMNYWQALPSGMNDEVLGVFNFYQSNLEDYRENAQKLYGCRGIFIPALTSPETGLSTHGGSWIVNWISGAGWLCQLFYDYYLFTRDREFLKERLLPFMREVALFYEDYFTYDAAGKVVISPSTSPENWPKEACQVKSPSAMHPRMTVNATMDVAIARELLGNLLKGAGEFDLYPKNIERWECMLDGLPEYEVNEDGAIREWLDHRFSDNYEHRHLSHIYPVFPGFEVTEESHPNLFPGFKKAVDLRGTVGQKDQTGWSLAHMANIRARMGDGDSAYHCLEAIMQTCVGKNFFTYHNDYRGSGISVDWFFGRSTPFQIDANMGFTSAIYEMLIQSSPSLIKILPALPPALDSGKVTNIRTRAGVDVDFTWKLEPFELSVTLRSLTNQTVDIQICVPSKQVFSVNLEAGVALENTWTLQDNKLITIS